MNDRLALIDKVTHAIHDNRRRRSPQHGEIRFDGSPSGGRHDRIATAGECGPCRDDASFVVDELGPLLTEAGS